MGATFALTVVQVGRPLRWDALERAVHDPDLVLFWEQWDECSMESWMSAERFPSAVEAWEATEGAVWSVGYSAAVLRAANDGTLPGAVRLDLPDGAIVVSGGPVWDQATDLVRAEENLRVAGVLDLLRLDDDPPAKRPPHGSWAGYLETDDEIRAVLAGTAGYHAGALALVRASEMPARTHLTTRLQHCAWRAWAAADHQSPEELLAVVADLIAIGSAIGDKRAHGGFLRSEVLPRWDLDADDPDLMWPEVITRRDEIAEVGYYIRSLAYEMVQLVKSAGSRQARDPRTQPGVALREKLIEAISFGLAALIDLFGENVGTLLPDMPAPPLDAADDDGSATSLCVIASVDGFSADAARSAALSAGADETELTQHLEDLEEGWGWFGGDGRYFRFELVGDARVLAAYDHHDPNHTNPAAAIKYLADLGVLAAAGADAWHVPSN